MSDFKTITKHLETERERLTDYIIGQIEIHEGEILFDDVNADELVLPFVDSEGAINRVTRTKAEIDKEAPLGNHYFAKTDEFETYMLTELPIEALSLLADRVYYHVHNILWADGPDEEESDADEHPEPYREDYDRWGNDNLDD